MKNKYIIGAVLLAVVIIFASYSFIKMSNASNVSKVGNVSVPEVSSSLTTAKKTFDFGDIDIFGGKVRTTYVLKNEGNEDVVIQSAITSCMCTTGEIGDLTFGMHESEGGPVVIPAGEEKVLTAIFDPLAHGPNATGKIKRELIVRTNSTVTPQVSVTFIGNVVKNKSE